MQAVAGFFQVFLGEKGSSVRNQTSPTEIPDSKPNGGYLSDVLTLKAENTYNGIMTFFWHVIDMNFFRLTLLLISIVIGRAGLDSRQQQKELIGHDSV